MIKTGFLKTFKFMLVGSFVFLTFSYSHSKTVGNSYSQTEYSKYIAQLQRRFGSVKANRPIVIVDRDELQVQQSITGKNLNQIVEDFLEKHSGLDFSSNDADFIRRYYETEARVSIPLYYGTPEEVCVVLPSSPNGNAHQEAHRLLRWSYFKNVPEYKNKKVKHILSRKIASKLSDYHEISHCLDDKYMVELNIGFAYFDEEYIHKSEIFAEVHGMLLLAQDGHNQVGPIRSLYRLLGSFVGGRYSSLLGPRLDMNEISWGTVYSIYRSVDVAQEYIDSYGISESSLQEITEMALQITENTALSSVEFHAHSQLQKKPKELFQLIEELKNSSNPLTREYFAHVEKATIQYQKRLQSSWDALFEDEIGVNKKDEEPIEKLIEKSSGEATAGEAATEKKYDLFSLDNCEVFKEQKGDLVAFQVHLDERRKEYYKENTVVETQEYFLLKNAFSCLEYILE